MALRWDRTLDTGFDEIDEQHRRLFRALDDVLESQEKKLGKDAVLKLLAFLQDYIQRHFEMEETIMESVDYPGLAQHKAHHKEFFDEITYIGETFRKNGHGALITIKLQTCSVRWLREHIYGEDKAMAAFLRTVHPPTDGRSGSGTS